MTTALVLLFWSGFTGLVYQVTWQKYLEIYLGSHASATALTLSAFFLFLSLGYQVIGKRTHLMMTHKLLLYGILEGMIGFYSLVSPNYFHFLNEHLNFHLTSPVLNLMGQFGFVSLFIGFPTFLMGGTIPVLTQGLSANFEMSHRVHALVYGINTLGAFIGTLCAGFYMLESWGLPLTLFCGSMINFAILLACYLVFKLSHNSYNGPPRVSETLAAGLDLSKATRWGLYLVSFLSGFYVFSLETIVIRMTGVVLGSSTYTFTIVVACFICAIAVGSLSLNFWMRPKASLGRVDNLKDLRVFISIQMLMFVSTCVLYAALQYWPEFFYRFRVLINPSHVNFEIFWVFAFVGILFFLFIPVGLMGMNLPMLFYYLRNRQSFLSEIVGKIYSVNSLGCTLGALFGGYYLFYFLPADTIFKICLALILIVVPILAILYRPTVPAFKYSLSLVTAVFTVGMITVIKLPRWQTETFVPSLMSYGSSSFQYKSYSELWDAIKIKAQPKILFTQYDPNILVAVAEDQKGRSRALYVNGKPDAATSGDDNTRALTALIPLSLAPKIDQVFIVGLGAGLSTGITTSFSEVQHVQVAEISEGVVAALPFFDKWNSELEKRKNKYSIHINDAYKILTQKFGEPEQSTKWARNFDVILCEPSNTWVAGVEKLYTREFYKAVLSRLNEDGIFAQWFPLFATQDHAFLAVLNSFQAAFPEVTLWTAKGAATILIGSRHELKPQTEILERRFKEQNKFYKFVNLHTPLSILSLQLLPPIAIKGLVLSHPALHTLERPTLAYESGRAQFAGQFVNLDNLLGSEMKRPFNDPSLPGISYVYEDLGATMPNSKLPESFFTDGIKFLEKSNSYKFNVHRLRLSYADAYPKNKMIVSSDPKLRQYQYLSATKAINKIPPLAEEKVSLPSQLLFRFNQLMVMHKPAHAERIASLMPTRCDDSARVAEVARVEPFALGPQWAARMPSALQVGQVDQVGQIDQVGQVGQVGQVDQVEAEKLESLAPKRECLMNKYQLISFVRNLPHSLASLLPDQVERPENSQQIEKLFSEAFQLQGQGVSK